MDVLNHAQPVKIFHFWDVFLAFAKKEILGNGCHPEYGGPKETIKKNQIIR